MLHPIEARVIPQTKPKSFKAFDVNLDLESLDIKLNDKYLLAEDYLNILRALSFEPCLNDVLDTVYLYNKTDKEYKNLSDNFTIYLYEKVKIILAKKYGKKASNIDFNNALTAGAINNTYNPIKDILEGKAWDGVERLDDFMSYFKDSNDVFKEYLTFFLFGSIERLYKGFQNPILVLDGGQGLGKSYLVSWLARPFKNYFKSGELQPDNKDGKMDIVENFIFDYSEASNLNKKEINALKSFITLDFIKERGLYQSQKSIRKVIANIIMTKNSNGGFLRDTTGNRRYHIANLLDINKAYSDKFEPLNIWLEIHYRWTLDKDKSWIENLDKDKRDLINKGHEESNPVFELLDELATPLDGGFISVNDLYQTLESKDKSFNRRIQSKVIEEYFLSKYNIKKIKTYKAGNAGVWGFKNLNLKGL